MERTSSYLSNNMKEHRRANACGTTRSLDMKINNESNNITNNINSKADHHHHHHSWKVYTNNNNNQSFHDEEEYMNIDGFSWPPRSYTCSFCKREFRSAQALGGHMNVHRKDRARLRQSPPSPPSPPPAPRDIGFRYGNSTITTNTTIFKLNNLMNNNYNNPNPNPNYYFSSSSSLVSTRIIPPLISSSSSTSTSTTTTRPLSSSLANYNSPYSSVLSSNESNKMMCPWSNVEYGAELDHPLLSINGSDLTMTMMIKNKQSVSGVVDIDGERGLAERDTDTCKNPKTAEATSTAVRLDLEIGLQFGDSKTGRDLDLELRLGCA